MRFRYLLAASALLAGCVTTHYTLVDPSAPKYDPVPPEQVRILTSEAELDTLNYTRIAIIEATGSGEFTDQSGMLKAMRKKAGELGANGVLLPQINEPGAGAKVAAAVFGTGTERKGNAIAIRILGKKEPASSSEPPEPGSEYLPVVHVTVTR